MHVSHLLNKEKQTSFSSSQARIIYEHFIIYNLMLIAWLAPYMLVSNIKSFFQADRDIL